MLEALWADSARSRTRNCRRVPTSTVVNVERSTESGRAFARDLQSCGHVTCPRCGPIIAKHERDRLYKAVQAHLEAGGSVLTGVFTVSHGPKERLATVLNVVKSARQSAMRGYQWGKDRKGFGITGFTWHVETPHGRNGWHPHIHILLFMDADLADDELAALDARLFGRYSEALKDMGRRAHHAFNRLQRVRDVEALPVYVAKSISAEMALGDDKTGAGITPRGLLFRFTQTGDMGDMDLYNEYERAMDGERWRQWSRGLAKQLGVEEGSEAADKEAVEAEDAEDAKGDSKSETVLTIEADVWIELTKRRLVSTIYSLVEEHRDDEAQALVDRVAAELRGSD